MSSFSDAVNGALQKLIAQPLETALLCVLALGSFALRRGGWRRLQAIRRHKMCPPNH